MNSEKTLAGGMVLNNEYLGQLPDVGFWVDHRQRNLLSRKIRHMKIRLLTEPMRQQIGSVAPSQLQFSQNLVKTQDAHTCRRRRIPWQTGMQGFVEVLLPATMLSSSSVVHLVAGLLLVNTFLPKVKVASRIQRPIFPLHVLGLHVIGNIGSPNRPLQENLEVDVKCMALVWCFVNCPRTHAVLDAFFLQYNWVSMFYIAKNRCNFPKIIWREYKQKPP